MTSLRRTERAEFEIEVVLFRDYFDDASGIYPEFHDHLFEREMELMMGTDAVSAGPYHSEGEFHHSDSQASVIKCETIESSFPSHADSQIQYTPYLGSSGSIQDHSTAAVSGRSLAYGTNTFEPNPEDNTYHSSFKKSRLWSSDLYQSQPPSLAPSSLSSGYTSQSPSTKTGTMNPRTEGQFVQCDTGSFSTDGFTTNPTFEWDTRWAVPGNLGYVGCSTDKV